MHRRGLLSTVLLGGFLAGCLDPEPGNGTSPEREPAPDERAEITSHELVRYDVGTDEETVVIEGTVQIHEPDLQHIELRGQFFDAEDELLDTTFERLRELEVGTQPFDVQYPETGPAAEAVDGYTIDITTIV